jgi:uncharacterized membrane protein
MATEISRSAGRARSHLVDKPLRAKTSARGITLVRAVTIRKPAAELYAFWRNVENLQQVIKHPVSITPQSDTVSHWSVSAPLKSRVEWDSEITEDQPNRRIAWRSLPGGQVMSAGVVRFEDAPGDEGTEVIVEIEYDPPGGRLGAAVAKLTRDSASSQIYDALHRFKALMEAGEIPTIDGQSVGGPQRPRKGQK